MKFIFVTFLTFLLMKAGAQQSFYNDPNAQTRTINGSFHAVSVASGIELVLSQGNTNALAVSATEESMLERLITVVDNGVLKIYYNTEGMKWVNHKKSKLKAYLSFTSLDGITARSGARISSITTISADKLGLNASSGSSVILNIKAATLKTTISSGSVMEINGSADELTAKASSGSSLKAWDMVVQDCSAKSSSGSSIRITITKELNANANSGGQVRYKGSAVIKDINVSSGGSVKKENS